LGAAGFTPEELQTRCDISLVDNVITESHLAVTAKVPGIDKEKFDAAVGEAKTNCLISKLFNTNITHEAVLL
jgi:osmotically inducible protein OsmC